MYSEVQETQQSQVSNDWLQAERAPAPKRAAIKAPRRSQVGDATDMYLSEMGRSQLLTADEEKSLARKVQKDDGAARALEEVGKAIGLTRERVCQIQVEALRDLKEGLTAEGIRQDAVI